MPAEAAPADGMFPDEFYATTHLPTQVRVRGQWVEVEGIEMDLGIRVDPRQPAARTVPMGEVKRGDQIVIGREGVRVIPLQRPRDRDVFSFMESQVSSERPHGHVIGDIAKRLHAVARQDSEKGKPGSKVLLAGGPAIVHAGGREALTWLIDEEFIHVLFCGNALAAHDMEVDLYGTSLGYGHAAGRVVPHGHEHHLRTINRISAIGSIEAAVRSGVIKTGNHGGLRAGGVSRSSWPARSATMARCPASSRIRWRPRQAMRAAIPGIGLALLVASTLHAVATGNLLPATIPSVCVDVNPAVPTKLADRGSFQAVGLVMDAASFLRELARELGWRPMSRLLVCPPDYFRIEYEINPWMRRSNAVDSDRRSASGIA